MSASLEHDVQSPEHNKHGKQDQEFKADDLTSRKSKKLVQDNAIAAVVKYDDHEQQAEFINDEHQEHEHEQQADVHEHEQ